LPIFAGEPLFGRFPGRLISLWPLLPIVGASRSSPKVGASPWQSYIASASERPQCRLGCRAGRAGQRRCPARLASLEPAPHLERTSFPGRSKRVLAVSVAAVQLDPAQAASLAQLRYVSDDVPGYRRRRCGRGFSYHHADGRLVEAPEQRAWIRSLRIPPAWEDVWISPYRNGHLL